jgi:signal transduction histidine kinase
MLLNPSIISPFAAAPMLAALLNLFLVFWVGSRAPQGPLRRSFIVWSVWIALWNVGIAGGYLLQDESQALAWWGVFSPWVVRFLPVLFLHFVLTLTGGARASRFERAWLGFGYTGALVFASVDASTNWLMSGVHRFYWGYYPAAAPADALYGPYFFVVIGYAFRRLVGAVKATTGHRRNQLKYVLGGAAIAFGSGLTNFIPLQGVPVYPVGNLFNTLYALLMAYAIIEHHLADIRLVVRRSTVYAGLAGALTVTYFSIVWVFEHLLGRYGVEESMVYYASALPITLFIAPVVQSRLEPWLTGMPFWKVGRNMDALRSFEQAVLSIFQLTPLCDAIIKRLTALFEVKGGAVYLRSNGKYVCHSTVDATGAPLSIQRTPELLGSLEKRPFAIQESIGLSTWPFALTVPLVLDEEMIGFVGLGEKASGDIFNADDQAFLNALMVPASVAIRNAKNLSEIEDYRKKLRGEHDMALLGLLATELAHELSKPLTRILNEHVRLEAVVEGSSVTSVQKIQREARSAADITESFAMLAPSIPLKRVPTVVNDLVESGLVSLGLVTEEQLIIERRFETWSPIRVNPTLMQQVIANILHNASQAMDSRGMLVIETRNVETAVSGQEIIITDYGVGVPQEYLERVFDPFFTTKQSVGGRGVGLTLSRAIVERHGGSIVLQSPIHGDRGTRVTIFIPTVKEEQHA